MVSLFHQEDDEGDEIKMVKGWKKVGKTRWINDSGDKGVVISELAGGKRTKTEHYHVEKADVEGRLHHNFKSIKKTKSKTQALKFAMKYMRSHKNG